MRNDMAMQTKINVDYESEAEEHVRSGITTGWNGHEHAVNLQSEAGCSGLAGVPSTVTGGQPEREATLCMNGHAIHARGRRFCLGALLGRFAAW